MSGIRQRDYESIDLAVSVIIHAVEYGFDTNSDDAYEFFASEGRHGDPDDLTHYTYLHLRSQVLQLASDALNYLEDYPERD